MPMRSVPALDVYQNGHTLYFVGNESTAYEIQIYKETVGDDPLLVYSCELPTGTASLELPTEIPSGMYLIQFVCGVVCYYGDIDL